MSPEPDSPVLTAPLPLGCCSVPASPAGGQGGRSPGRSESCHGIRWDQDAAAVPGGPMPPIPFSPGTHASQGPEWCCPLVARDTPGARRAHVSDLCCGSGCSPHSYFFILNTARHILLCSLSGFLGGEAAFLGTQSPRGPQRDVWAPGKVPGPAAGDPVLGPAVGMGSCWSS